MIASAALAGATLVVNGVLTPVAPGFDETRTVSQFAEKGTIESAYSAQLGPGAEVGLELRLKPKLALSATAGFATRSNDDAYTARLPHPLYLDRHRVSSGEQGGFSYTEMAGHVGLSYIGGSPRLGYALFGGPSLYRVRAELVDRADTREAYPYDDVSFTLVTTRASRVAPGFHVGARLTRPIGPRLHLGLQARYGMAKASLKPKAEDETKVTAGGLQVSVGARWSF